MGKLLQRNGSRDGLRVRGVRRVRLLGGSMSWRIGLRLGVLGGREWGL